MVQKREIFDNGKEKFKITDHLNPHQMMLVLLNRGYVECNSSKNRKKLYNMLKEKNIFWKSENIYHERSQSKMIYKFKQHTPLFIINLIKKNCIQKDGINFGSFVEIDTSYLYDKRASKKDLLDIYYERLLYLNYPVYYSTYVKKITIYRSLSWKINQLNDIKQRDRIFNIYFEFQ